MIFALNAVVSPHPAKVPSMDAELQVPPWNPRCFRPVLGVDCGQCSNLRLDVETAYKYLDDNARGYSY